MTQLRKGSFIRKAKDITIGSALALSFLSGSVIFTGCSNNSDDEASYSYEETSYSKGVRSYIKEVSPGNFSIEREESVGAEQSAAIVSYLDGHTDTLSTSAAKALIDEEIRTNHSSLGYHNGLSSMLLYGGMGYMLGRTLNNGYINSYRDKETNHGRFYSTPTAYSHSKSVTNEINASRYSRTVTTRPSGGRSGFFNRSGGRSGG